MKKTCVMLAVLSVAGLVGGWRLAAEEQPQRIAWEVKVFQGFSRACEKKKPLVVYFRLDYCENCKGPCKHCEPVDVILKGKDAAALADKAVWVWQSHGQDDDKGNVAKLMKELKIERFPVLVVLEADATALKERGRIVGSRKPEEYLRELNNLLGEQTGTAKQANAPSTGR